MAKAKKSGIMFQRTIQYLSLGIFTLLFFLNHYPPKEIVPLDIYLRIDPLIALGASIAARDLIENSVISLSIVIATLLLGRIFCGYLCPFGALIDLFERFFVNPFKKGSRDDPERHLFFRSLRPIKYYLLAIILTSAVFGVTFFFIFDPISLLTRSFTHFFYPLAIYVANAFLDGIRPIAGKSGFTDLSHLHFIQPKFYANSAIFFMLALILFASFYRSRFWCRYLCPLGALLCLFSKTAIVKRSVSQDCNGCGLCQKKCPMDAIGESPFETLQGECIQCEVCVKTCPQQAIDFPCSFPFSSEKGIRVDLSRRAVLNSVAAGFTLSFLVKTGTASTQTNIIRPPGAMPEEEFLKRCIRCGACIKSCVTNTLQPVLFEAGFESLFTPNHQMRLAGCDQSCNMCGTVCPTQAIRRLPLYERKYARIGTAVIDRGKCLAWEQNKLCIICDEQCPYNAIVFKNIGGVKKPFIDETRCNGCGICEEKCPVKGDSAIRVSPMGEIRMMEGSYITESRHLNISLTEEKDRIEETKGEDAPAPASSDAPPDQKLPPGFIMD